MKPNFYFYQILSFQQIIINNIYFIYIIILYLGGINYRTNMGDNTRIYMRNNITWTNTLTSNTILQNPNNSNYPYKMVSIWIPSGQRIIHKRQKKIDTTTFLTTHMVSNGIYKPKRNIFLNVPNSKLKRRNRRHVLLPKNNLLTRAKTNSTVK